MKIGVQALDEEYSPPGQALSRRGMQDSLRGFYGIGGDAEEIISAVANGKIDVAIVWGPLAGFAARSIPTALNIRPISPEMDIPALPFTFQIAMGVRKGDAKLRNKLDAILQQRKSEIQRILTFYGVPQLEINPTQETGGGE